MKIATLQTVDFDKLTVGDLVSEEVIDYLRNNLPPILDWSNLFQAGGAVMDRLLPDGTLRPSFNTFSRNETGSWEYCGACLKGESLERGSIPVYCN